MHWTSADIACMRRAMALAARGQATTFANPRVGCVLVKNGAAIGEGWHRGDGCVHAETAALADAADRGNSTRACTAYVTLEPCCHSGRQPPCTEALIDAGVARVVVASKDPDPLVSGKGFAVLRQAGIEVEQGLLQDESRALNPGFFHRHSFGVPWLVVKLAVSLDGRICAADGGSRYISCKASRVDAMHWRARSQAILTSSATVLADNPRHTVRGLAAVTQPQLWLLDSRARVEQQARVFERVPHSSGLPGFTNREVVWVRPRMSAKKLAALPSHIRVMPVGARVDPLTLLQGMAAEQINEVLTECGGSLAGALIEAGLVNRLLVYQAPIFLGNRGMPMAVLGIEAMQQARELTLLESRSLGTDRRLLFALP